MVYLSDEVQAGEETLHPGYYLLTTRFSRWPQSLTLVSRVGEDEESIDLFVNGPKGKE